jgi:Fur family transcriptional regulator, ferric uptake regulator
MDIEEIKSMLKKYGLKLTSPRLKVLEVFFSSIRAVTYCEILEFTAKTVDRVTVYRTLKLFEDIGLIHRIIGASDVPAYALSIGTDSTRQAGFKQHLHFCCTKCHGVFCLNDHSMPSIILPEPYQVHSMNLILTGLCRACNFSADDPD